MKKKSILKGMFVVTGLLTITVFSGCGLVNFIMGVNSHLITKGYVSKSIAGNRSLTLIPKGTGDGFINNYDQISITPTKLELTFKYITLWENYEIVNNEVHGSGKRIGIDINAAKDLTEIDTFTPIFNIDQGINFDQVGTYKCIELQLDDKCIVSGSATVNGKVYSFTDRELSLGWGGIGIPLRDETAITITKDSEQTAGIVMDIEDALSIWRSDDITPESDPNIENGFVAIVDSDTNAYLAFNQPVILPFVGSNVLNVKRVLLDITNDSDFDNNTGSSYFLRVICIENENEELMSAGWLPVYGDEETGDTANMVAYSPAMLYLQSIVKNADGSYKIDDINYGDTAVRERALHFPAFQIGLHTGIFYYGDEDCPDRKTAQYTAVLED